MFYVLSRTMFSNDSYLYIAYQADDGGACINGRFPANNWDNLKFLLTLDATDSFTALKRMPRA